MKDRELCLGALLALLGLFYLVGVQRLRQARLEGLSGEQVKLSREVEALRNEIKRLRQAERALSRGDPELWEALARRELGYLAPGEVAPGSANVTRSQ